MLLVPAAAQLLEPGEALPASLSQAGEAAAVHPDRVARGAELEDRNGLRRLVQQLAVVADQQHGLGRTDKLGLQPSLGRDVEIVVRLVEQQDVVRTAEQRLESEPLLLAAGKRGEVAPAGPVVADAEGCGAAGVEDHLRVVAAGVGVLGQRVRVPHLVRLTVVVHQGQLEGVDLGHGGAESLGGEGEEQVANGRAVTDAADELAHHAEAAAAGDGPAGGGQVTRNDLQQGRLAGSVRADQGDRGAVADPEGHIVEQHAPVGQVEADPGKIDMAHGQPW